MSYFAFHMQDPFLDWNKHLAEAHAAGSPFPGIKSFHPEDYGQAQAASPGIKFVYRNYADKVNQGAWIDQAGVSPAEGDKAADAYIVRFSDSVNQHMGITPNGTKFVESLNEEYPTGDPVKLGKIVAFDRAFVRRLKIHCPGVAPVVFCAAIGNPGHNEYGALVDLAKETAAAGGAFGYHAYTSVLNGTDWIASAAHQRDLHLRWNVIDQFLISQGIRVKWALGEGGPIISNPDGYGPAPVPGWRAPEVYGGNTDLYIDHLRRLDQVLAGTTAAKEGRLMFLSLFTSPGRDQWASFDVPGYEVAQYVKTNPTPAPAPSPDPDPEPDPEPDPPPGPDPDPDIDPGLPREPYSRIVLVAPQNITLETWLAICAQAYEKRRTVAFSYDDAGIGQLANKRAILYGIPTAVQAEFVEFYADFYPGTVVEFAQLPADLADSFQAPVGDGGIWS